MGKFIPIIWIEHGPAGHKSPVLCVLSASVSKFLLIRLQNLKKMKYPHKVETLGKGLCQ